MKTTNALLLIAAVGLLAGCSNNPEPTSTATQTPSAPAFHTLGAAPTDITATMLHARAGLTVSRLTVGVSQALPPVDLLAAGQAPVATVHTQTFQIAPQGTTGKLTIPIDSTDGEAYLFLTPQTTTTEATEAALRDVIVLDPNGVRVNLRAAKFEHGEDDLAAMSTIPLAGHPAGIYTVQFKSGMAQSGIALEAHVPSSKIVMTLLPSTLEHLLGNQSYVDATLTENGKPIAGAHVTSRLIDGENLADVTPVVFTEVGNGVYRAPIHTLLTDSNKVGAYLADVVAEGAAPSGAAFQRHGRTGFHYGIPTARILGVVGQHTLTNATGQITGFDVDVNVESASLDRLEISGKLTVQGDDGQERPIAIAHYGTAFEAGQQIVTLHFDAGNVRLTGAEGNFYVRDIQMYSLGTNTLFHRDLAASNHVFPSIARANLMKLQTLSPAQEQLVNEGALRND
jgi:hypothetical protein